MSFFELQASDISNLNDSDLRELVARLCEAELVHQGKPSICIAWGGAQEAPDGGLDVHVKNAGMLTKPNFVPRENTGFQVKKNSMGAAACAKEMREKGVAKKVIADLMQKNGAYIIVSGKDSCTDTMLLDRQNSMKSVVKELKNDGNAIVDFYGSDRLATWLRCYPSVALWVRSRLGKPLSGWRQFERWAGTPINQQDDFLMDDHPCVTDFNSRVKQPLTISDGINLVRKKLRLAGSIVRITGLSGVGKTRFAQALFEASVGADALSQSDVIYADLGDDLAPTASELISYLIASDSSSAIVLDNCPSDTHRKLQQQIARNSSKLRILTIEYDISDDRPEETEVIHIEPSSEAMVSKLVQRRFSDLNQFNANKIAQLSGGNARLAIALANRVKADETLANFTDEDLFKRLFIQRKDAKDNLLENSEILSLVYSFNISNTEHNDELTVLSDIAGIDRRSLYRSHSELLRRKISQKRGNWRAVLPHALANRLARQCLQNISYENINNQLFKQENIRLFISCAHRLGYLHDCEHARELVLTWIRPSGRLHDIATCDDQLLQAIDFIAPVFPEEILNTIEVACENPSFASRDHENFDRIVNLLCKIAYDEILFDRSVAVILKFAESEKPNENSNSIVDRLAQLFTLYLSGTHASPARRQKFIKNLLSSSYTRHHEIAQKLLTAAFTTHHWSSFSSADFGARARDFGWEPKSQQDVFDWYSALIDILKPHLSSEDNFCKKIAQKVISNNFRGLWSFASSHVALEEIVNSYASGGCWPEIWRSIKQTIYFDGKHYPEELMLRLGVLESLAAPSDPYTEMEAYIFTNTWDYYEELDDDYSDREKRVHEKLVGLGELAISESTYLVKLAPRLWQTNTNSLWSFGVGLAKGSTDPIGTFEFLTSLLQLQIQDKVVPTVFNGFISGVHAQEPILARQIQERVLLIPELKPYFVYLLGATPIAPWGARMLIDVAKTGEIEANRFVQISYGRVHESISDSDLTDLLGAINSLDFGIFSSLQILSMRFFIDNKSEYVPSDGLRAIGRNAIAKLLGMHRNEINRNETHGLDKVAEVCFSTTIAEEEIKNIVGLLCEGIETYRLYNFDMAHIIGAVMKSFPEALLNNVFSGGDRERILAHLLFRDRVPGSDTSLNIVPISRLANWCGKDENKIQAAAKAVSAYSHSSLEGDELDESKGVLLTEHFKTLLDLSTDKVGIVDILFNNTWPSSWSGSRAAILEKRCRAFGELLNHPSIDVQIHAKKKLAYIENSILKEREHEVDMNRRDEQRFE